MTHPVDIDPILDRWFDDGPTEIADRVIDGALELIDSTPQEQRSRLSGWRRPTGASFDALSKLAAVVLLVVLVGAGVSVLKDQAGRQGALPSPSAPASPMPSASDPLSGWPSFRSVRHGYALRYPPGWTARAAAAPWLYGASDPLDIVGSMAVDQFDAPSGASLVVASIVLPAGLSESEWRARGSAPTACSPPRSEWTPVTIDGLPGGLHGGMAGCDYTEAAVADGGRVYQFRIYADRQSPSMIVDPVLFDALLATVHLDPASADDSAPAASPAGGPSPSGTPRPSVTGHAARSSAVP
jgi:hypothetical protein